VGPESQPELGAPRFETTERTVPFYAQHSLYLRSEMVRGFRHSAAGGGSGTTVVVIRGGLRGRVQVKSFCKRPLVEWQPVTVGVRRTRFLRPNRMTTVTD
jgi:hypothetical protein